MTSEAASICGHAIKHRTGMSSSFCDSVSPLSVRATYLLVGHCLILLGNAPATTKCMHAESVGIALFTPPHCGGTRGACKSEAPQNAIHITVERRNRSDNFPPEIMGGRHIANYLSAKCPPTVLLLPLACRWCVVRVWFSVFMCDSGVVLCGSV